MIYTSYFSKVSQLINNNIFPIAIIRKLPNFYKLAQYSALGPTYDILKEYKQFNDTERYTQRFYNEILNHLNQDIVVSQLYALYNNQYQNIALICYETSEKFCHRHLVADWLNLKGYDVKEWNMVK